MALKSTIFRVEIQIADMGRGYYADHSITLARHPSETDERMMVRLLAFILHADDALVFGESIGNDDEPSLWRKDLTGSVRLWIDVGQPDEKRLRKACGRSEQVVVYCYGGHDVDVWLSRIRGGECFRNLAVIKLPGLAPAELAKLARPRMNIQATIQDGQVWLIGKEDTIHLDLSGATAITPP